MVGRPGSLEVVVIDPGFWRGRKVLLTGHTGFKGAWASLLLEGLGATVDGVALEPATERDVFVAADVGGAVRHRVLDIRDREALLAAVRAAEPEIVLHMAAQALVRPSYADPVGTYDTNVMGTVHLLDAVRQVPGVRAVLVVTSDKCYENTNSPIGYRETDRMGGHDPYSNSKGCAELVTDAFRRSYFGGPGATLIASGRAGNVIGGGDWSSDRLVPDAIRAFLGHAPLRIRNPGAIRPWQHVLDPVLGYLTLLERLSLDGPTLAEGWNFGPSADSEVPVETVVDGLTRRWGNGARWERDGADHPHEANLLKLDCSKASAGLRWRPLLGLDEALDLTVAWYKAQASGADMRAVTRGQIETVLSRVEDTGHPARTAGA